MKLDEALARETDFLLRPRYAETDQMGVVYYGHYLTWFECARTEWLRQAGRSYADMEAQGVFLPVRRCSVEYHAPARYDRPIAVRARVTRISPARVDFSYTVVDTLSQALLAEGASCHAFVDGQGRVCRRGFEVLGLEK